MYPDVRSFVEALEDAGELVRISRPVSPVLEIAALADLVSKAEAPGRPSASAQRNDPRFFSRGGPALLFENVAGSKFPVLINAYGSYRRMEMALGCARGGFEEVGGRIGELVKPQPPRSFEEAIEKARQFAPLLRIGPKRVKRGHCQEVVETGDAVDLTKLPLIRCWPHDGDFAALGYPAETNARVPGLGHAGIDGARWEREFRGRYITLAGIHTIHADDADKPKPASHNIGMYRVQLLGQRTMAMHWHMHHDGASHWRSWKKRGEPMPVAIALGGESVLPYAATCPLPPGISELLMAGFLNGKGVRMVRGKTVPLWVPANAEIVIEGYVSHEAGLIGWDPGRTVGRSALRADIDGSHRPALRVDGSRPEVDGTECRPAEESARRADLPEPLGPGAVFEGPFGDHTGFYSLPDRYPVLTVTAITHRRGAIYPTTIVGLPPQEDYYLGKATERIMFPLLKTLIHDIDDYDLPQFGAFHNCAMLRIHKAYPLQARRVMHAVWGAGQMAWTKCIFVVDDSVDVHDTFAVLRAAAKFCRPDRDIERVRGPLDILDHAAPRLGAGTKIGFDCTPKREGEQAGRAGLTPPWEPPAGAAREAFLARVRGVEGVRNAAWPEALGGWLFVQVDKTRAGQGRAAAEAVLSLAECPPFVVVVGPEADVADPDGAMFHWCANFDPGRDAVFCGPRVAFDATPKMPGDEAGGEPVRPWPPIIRMDPEVTERVRGLVQESDKR